MTFGQLIEYNLRNIFLEESYIKCGGEIIPRPFFKKSKLSISLDQYSRGLHILLKLLAKLRTVKIYWNYAAEHLHLPQIKLFFFKKKRSGTSLPTSFSTWFLKKNISLVAVFYLTKFQCLVALLREILGNIYIVILC